MTNIATPRPGREATSELLHQAADPLREFTDATVRALAARLEDLGQALRDRPALTIGIGIAAGYVLARILHRG